MRTTGKRASDDRPTNVVLHRLSAKLDLDSISYVVEHGQLDVDHMPRERGVSHRIGYARALSLAGRGDDAFAELGTAERASPQLVRNNPRVRDTLRDLLPTSARSTSPARPSEGTYMSARTQDAPDQRDVEFVADGVTIRGRFRVPGTAGPHPLVILAHGLGGLKEWRIPEVAAALVDAGIAALWFDYRNWGDSEGRPREEISHCGRIEDWRSAISYARPRAHAP